MKKIGKSIIIQILIIITYVLISYKVYIFLNGKYIIDKCETIYGGLGSGYYCYGYYNPLDKVSLIVYLLFIWLTIIPFVTSNLKTYKKIFLNIYLLVIIVILSYIFYVWTTTPVIHMSDIPSGGGIFGK